MRQQLEKWGWSSEPEWILRTDGESGHITGQMREAADDLFNTPGGLGYFHDLLMQSAEQLDDAHQEWLENQIEILEAHLDALIAGSTF